jgi:predicted nuclease of predicted toxin-antitoxin system
VKFLLDENIPPTWLGPIQDAGYTATSWLKMGETGATDERVWNYALEHQGLLEKGCLISINEKNHRVRILPIL